MRLEGRTALVTGGASGIGAATCRRLAAEGATVAVTDVNAEGARAVAEEIGGRAYELDVRSTGSVRSAVEAAESDLAPLDILVNNAGYDEFGFFVNTDEDMWDRVIDVDLKAVWRGIKLAAPYIAARGGGSIISTSSLAALRGFPGLGAYGAAKGGVLSLTRVAAMELAGRFVRVNCICPGGIVTPILYDNPMGEQPIDPDMLRQLMAAGQPIPRAGEAADIANAALWLASDESSFVTGQAIVVDGGLSAEPDSRLRGQPLTMPATS